MKEQEHHPPSVKCVATLRPFQLSPAQIPVRRVDGRRGPQPLPGAQPRMSQAQPEGIPIPFGGQRRTTPPPVIYVRLFLTALGRENDEEAEGMPAPILYVHRPLSYPENQYAASVGAGDGRVRVFVQVRRGSLVITDSRRGPRSMVQAQRYRALPESMLAVLAGLVDGRPGAAAHPHTRALADGSWEAASRNGCGRAGALPWHLRSQHLPRGLGQQDGRAEDVPPAWIPPRAN
uniref:Uncharacterized protein LOC110200327 n=1 Tax=Phascolarctos cinereus TaxID=38626 RepID=A0A6P5JJG4_PHACI|nr:uncharacterized protein LOC110200327 [Phascolarctos cinereus]